MLSLSIGIYPTEPELRPQAQRIAHELNIPVAENLSDYTYALMLYPDSICLTNTLSKQTLRIDFLSRQLTYRRQHATVKKELIARAMGLKPGQHPFILDATAGLGLDSFIVASLGFEVTLLERSPIVWLLINDAIRRALLADDVRPIVKKMSLIQIDAMTWLKTTPHRPDIIYLDPMFPIRKKSALVKKEMQLFHDILGEDVDSDLLFEKALACAPKRIVVKRPRLAKSITGPEPSFSLKGSSSRFDVYLLT